jgi:hypothetical protein
MRPEDHTAPPEDTLSENASSGAEQNSDDGDDGDEELHPDFIHHGPPGGTGLIATAPQLITSAPRSVGRTNRGPRGPYGALAFVQATAIPAVLWTLNIFRSAPRRYSNAPQARDQPPAPRPIEQQRDRAKQAPTVVALKYSGAIRHRAGPGPCSSGRRWYRRPHTQCDPGLTLEDRAPRCGACRDILLAMARRSSSLTGSATARRPSW